MNCSSLSSSIIVFNYNRRCQTIFFFGCNFSSFHYNFHAIKILMNSLALAMATVLFNPRVLYFHKTCVTTCVIWIVMKFKQRMEIEIHKQICDAWMLKENRGVMHQSFILLNTWSACSMQFNFSCIFQTNCYAFDVRLHTLTFSLPIQWHNLPKTNLYYFFNFRIWLIWALRMA